MTNTIQSWVPLLTAKLCHDIASPLGALGLGLEMLKESGIDPEIYQTLQESCEAAQLRLKFYRLFFNEQANLSDVQTLLERMAELKSVKFEWQGLWLEDDRLSSLLLGCTHLALEALIRGGDIKVTLNDQITIEAEGPNVQWRSDCLEAISDFSKGLKTPDVRVIFIVYLHHISNNLNKKIAYSEIDRHKFSIVIS
jgi:histidine phosphotransferase ChpT